MMRCILLVPLLLLDACEGSKAPVAQPPASASASITASAVPPDAGSALPDAAAEQGWTAAAGIVSKRDALAALAAAEHVAVVRVTHNHQRCTNSISEAFAGEIVEVSRGSVAGVVGAQDHRRGFPGSGLTPRAHVGDIFLAALAPSEPFNVPTGNECIGERPSSVSARSRVIALVRVADLDAARALAASLR
ncbi:Hypothetical protein A7982_06238 [Minicystis rosea]|nr:Hypothetical protein A7982_06238 [Minicystis rosea]